MASNNLEDEVTFIRRTSDRLREQGVEPRPIDPQYSTLRDKPSTTERAQSMTAQYSEQAPGVRYQCILQKQSFACKLKKQNTFVYKMF